MALFVALAGCAAVAPPALAQDVTVTDDAGSTNIDRPALDVALDGQPVGVLSEEEVAGLLFMREEEKLARDVYLALYEEWGLNVFQNIAQSEATHMDAVLTLIERYGLKDPAASTAEGEFVDETLQGLYDQLVEEGSRSLADALKVGAAIEEIDILDLQTHLAETEQPDIQLVYQNLLKGSRNHLRAFASNLERHEGETYAPQYLSADAYDEIVGTGVERGRGR
jgi:hypothetical protein